MKNAFTLAEILITLSIIGVIAAITIPSLLQDVDNSKTSSQLKAALSIMNGAVKQATFNNGNVPYKCYTGKTSYSTSECGQFVTALKKSLNIIKECPAGQAVTQGCITSYKTEEEVRRSNDSSLTDEQINQMISGCGIWSNSNKNTIEAFVLSNGMILFYPYYKLFPGIDINGKAGPNKWGYDVFTLIPVGTSGANVFLPGLTCILAEPGGRDPKNIIIAN